jgi:hypothetical protein
MAVGEAGVRSQRKKGRALYQSLVQMKLYGY